MSEQTANAAETKKKKTIAEVMDGLMGDIQLVEMACLEIGQHLPMGAKLDRVRQLMKVIRGELAYAQSMARECPDAKVEIWGSLIGMQFIKEYLAALKNGPIQKNSKVDDITLDDAERYLDMNIRQRGIAEYAEVPFAYIKGDTHRRALGLYKEYGRDSNSRVIQSMRGDFCFPVYEVVPVDTDKVAFLRPMDGLYVVGVGTILLQWKAFLFFFGWTPNLLSDMEVLPWRIEKQNDMHSDLRDMAEDFHLTADERWSTSSLSTFLKRRVDWEATRIKNKATFMQAGLDCSLAIRLEEAFLPSLYRRANGDFKPFCQIPFAWWAEGDLARDYGFDRATKKVAIVRGKEMPVFPLRPWLYMHASGAFADLESSVVIGKYSELQAFLFEYGYADLFRAPDSALMGFFRRNY